MKRKPIAGETLYRVNSGNNARNREQVIAPVTVTSVGRKYFTVAPPDAPWAQVQHRLSDWAECTDYSINWVLYESIQEWEDEKEGNAICFAIVDAFRFGNNYKHVPLESLRKILALIEAKL